jgi:hypothetical protein
MIDYTKPGMVKRIPPGNVYRHIHHHTVTVSAAPKWYHKLVVNPVMGWSLIIAGLLIIVRNHRTVANTLPPVDTPGTTWITGQGF